MRPLLRKCLAALCAGVMALGLLPAGLAAETSPIQLQGGHFNAAYIEWAPVSGAAGYQVELKQAAAADSAYTALDNELIRHYADHWRADALGLPAGEYVFRVTPVKNGAAMAAFTSDPITVTAHERTGYAFYGGHAPGAYDLNGALKKDAQVLYVTNANKTSVSLKLGSKTYTGLESIISNIKNATTPIDIRILGRITGISGSVLKISSSKTYLTIEGVGNDAAADGWGFEINSTQNMELSNLAIMMVASKEGDGVTVNGAQYCWTHNCDFFYNTARNDDGQGDKEKGDGSLDTKRSQYITHAYNHFWDAGKCNLQGSGIDDTSDYITYHHNWFDHSDSRHPRVRVAHVHVYNNFYDNNDGYGIGAVYHATVFSDRNYFDHCKFPMLISNQGSDTGFFTGNSGTGESGGMTKAYGNIVVGGTYVPYSKNSSSFDAYDVTNITDAVPGTVKSKDGWGYDNFDASGQFYTYAADDASDVPAKVRAYAGRVQGGDIHFDMTKLTNANSKYPDPALLKVLTDYTGSDFTVGGGDNTITDPGTDPGTGTDPDPVDPVDPTPSGNTIGGTVYTLTGDQVYDLMAAGQGPSALQPNTGDYPGSYVASAQTSHKAGTDDFFTLHYAANSRVDPSQTTFSDGYQPGHRINFQGAAEREKNAVSFTTDGPATVCVWWVGGGGSGKPARSMTILDSAGQTVATSAESSADTSTPVLSTMELTGAGTYYLGGDVGKNFIYKVTVSTGGPSLAWALEGDALTVTGDVGAGQTLWAACWKADGSFLAALPLTGEDPAAQLPADCSAVVLMWLDAHSAPNCAAVRADR